MARLGDGSDTVLTVDRGNTTLDCRLVGPGLHLRRRMRPERGAVRAFLDGCVPDHAIGLTVVARALDEPRRELEELGVRMREAGVDVACPLESRYDDADSLGVDRWVGAFAAFRRHGAAVVVDCGSALTVNLVSESGVFLGGAIAPGLTSMILGLAEAAPALPRADPEREFEIPARNTSDAVALGVVAGFACMVEGLVARVAAGSEVRGAVRVATGGCAPVLLRHVTTERFVHEPELIHDGLLYLSCARAS